MLSYVIQRLDTKEYYKHRPYGKRWEKDMKKAKRYARRGDAANAITLMRSYSYTNSDNVDMLVIELSMQPTGKEFNYPA